MLTCVGILESTVEQQKNYASVALYIIKFFHKNKLNTYSATNNFKNGIFLIFQQRCFVEEKLKIFFNTIHIIQQQRLGIKN